MTLEWLQDHCSDVLIGIGLLVGAMAILSMAENGSLAFVICTYSAVILVLTGVLSKLGLLASTSGPKQVVQLILFYSSLIIIATALVTVFTDVSVQYKIVKQTPIGAPMNPTNGGDAKSVPPAQMIGGLIEMVTRPHSWMFFPLLIAGIALLSVAIVLGAFGE
jgi:hypothetical protein